MHKVLKLQHHRHSGKLLPHHHTSYRVLGLLLMLVGCFMLILQQTVGADSLYVSVKLPAPLPVAPAVIFAPEDGFVTTTGLVTVSGTCPSATPPNVVVIVIDTVQIASTPCLASDTYSVDVMLQPGTHTVGAQIYNITEDPGPLSTAITATYTPPIPPVPTTPIPTPTPSPATPSPVTTPTTSQPSSAAPITDVTVSTKRPFFIYGPDSPVTWEGSISGGTPPYTVTFNWGDGTSNTYIVDNSGSRQFSHYYLAMGLYYITVTVTDAAGNSTVNTYASVSPYVSRDEQTDTNAPSGLLFTLPKNNGDTFKLAIFTLYAATSLVVISIWFSSRFVTPLIPALQHSYTKPKTVRKTTKPSTSRSKYVKQNARSTARRR